MSNLWKPIALTLLLSFDSEGRRLARHHRLNTYNRQQSDHKTIGAHDKEVVDAQNILFLYRGGADEENSNGIHSQEDAKALESNNIPENENANLQQQQQSQDESEQHNHHTDESSTPQIHVSLSSPPSHPKKKSNAVGDPDGNSSDDESDEEDILEELAELERQQQLNQSSGGAEEKEEFETLISLAERRESMKRRLEEVEEKMKENDLEVTLELLDETPSSTSTDDSSYHLQKDKITQDDTINVSTTSKRRKIKREKEKTTIDSATMDNLLLSAFRPILFLPPPLPRLPSSNNIDLLSRRRLDRRTLYHSLLAEFGGSHPIEGTKKSSMRRRYLEGTTARELRGALSLACQPRWRERVVPAPLGTVMSTKNVTGVTNDNDDEEDAYEEETEVPSDWYRGGVCLFPPLEEKKGGFTSAKQSQSLPQQPQFGPQEGTLFGEMNEEGYAAAPSPAPKPWRCTMSIQETLAMALAHSLSCGLALIDDEALLLVRKRVEQSLGGMVNQDGTAAAIDPEELRNAALIKHLIRLANEGKIDPCDVKSLEKTGFGKISDRMERDMKLDLDDCNDDLVVESLRLMKEDEKLWYDVEKEKRNSRPLSLVLFLRSDWSNDILRSKSAVETIAHECVKKDGIHLVMLGGKGIDAATTSLPDTSQVGMANGRMHRQHPSREAFSMMSNFPPGSPEFNAQMESGRQTTGQGQFTPGAFNVNNINASGVNDPEGSRRFNIFLARTVDQTGRPQIMGTIAPPQAGNLFPTILANMAKENIRKIKEEGVDEDNEQQAFFMKQMEDLVNQVEQMATEDDKTAVDHVNAAFFNATISSPFGSEVMNENNDAENGNVNPPPEVIRRAIQDAMTGVIDRLAQMSSSSSGGSGIPMNIARAFSQVLSNENLRRGIAENLSRAAPALIDPRCQGVMLSVYVPPGPGHPNKGMMPGDQFKDQKRPTSQSQGSQGKNTAPHGVGGWLNKILSSSDKGRDLDEESRESSPADLNDSVAGSEVSDATESSTKDEAAEEKTSSSELKHSDEQSRESVKQTKPKGSKRKRSIDRARTLAVAAAALAGSKKEQKENGKQAPTKLTPQQRSHRNLVRLQALCRSVPLPNPSDPVRARSWDAWADREEGSVVFRKNRDAILSHLKQRKLSIELHGSRGAGTVLRQMLSVRDVTLEIDNIVKCAVELEAAKSQRHDESPWGIPRESISGETKRAADKTLVAFLQKQHLISDTNMDGIRFIHPTSLELALSHTCGVSPSSSANGASSSSVLASHRSKEDLMALAQDKHERALVPNCVSPQDIGVTYDMIGGLSEVKELLRQSITYPLKFPHLYNEGIAREAVKGVLLFGPPGTGKTMLAKAVATEGGASFLSVDASSVENKWLGESEKNAKAVFTLARRLAPCVIFIDEVDSLLSSREGSSDDSAHGTLTSVKTTMMSEWDGLNSGTNGKGDAGSDRVVVIGSTNRPFDLDEAVLRRFPRRILVDLPDLETRREILEVTLSENRLGPDVNLTKIAERLEGYTGSDLKEVCREAVVQISHEQARMLDRGEMLEDEDDKESVVSENGFQMLRPVTMNDFESAMRKLKRSVSETGRELARVWEWNDEYGEIKKSNKRDALPQMMNMFV